MKETLSFLLALVLAAGLVLPASALEAEKVNTYTPGQFTDVPEGSWCAGAVQTAYEYGLMGGKSADRFDPSGLVTMAQAVAMACRVHALYCGDGPELPAGTGTPWYQPYADYAVAHQFLGFEGYTERDFNSPILRCDFAGALWAALPEEALSVISSVEDGGIPDVSPQAYYGKPVYALYRAGILTGSDAKGTFGPDGQITRGAAAAIAGRAVDPSLRKSLTLKAAPFEPVPLSQLANLKSLRRKAGDAEMAQAYEAARKVVEPLAGLSREEQLYGVASALRAMFDAGMSYSMETPHYNDPYGYFVLGVASCAGCTRATGLCLNMLGIPYEHVNENQYSHQWCRVNLNGTYWICDAYGLYCGPEPAPYRHPYL